MSYIKLIIESIVGLIIVALIMSFFTYFVAVRIRYYFLKFIGKEKSIKYLEGESDDDGVNSLSNGCLNYIIGITIMSLIFFILIVCWNYFNP